MKKTVIAVSGVLFLLGLAGCASSERMARMSGGVFDEYSVPKSQRVRSEKFQKKTESFAGAKRSGRTTPALHETLINVWPFFFRSDDYVSILWPVVDYDPFGMAIRPIYNQEGDDHSILFPLSSWNTAEKSGWVLFGWWNQHSSCFFPLFYRSYDPQSGAMWITPLCYRGWERPRQGKRNFLKESDFTQALLAYYGRETRVDDAGWAWLFRDDDVPGLRRELAYRLGKEGKEAPQDKEAMEKLRDEVFKGLPEKESSKFGFFPLFHVTEDKQDWSFHVVGPVFSVEREGEVRRVTFLGPFVGFYEEKPLESAARRPLVRKQPKHAKQPAAADPVVESPGAELKGENWFFSIPLLSRFAKQTYYCDTPEFRAVRSLVALSQQTPFERYRPEMEAELGKLDPALKLPPTVTDHNTMILYLEDLLRVRELATRHEYGGGFLPLFWYSLGEKLDWWAVPALLTWYRKSENSSGFWSLPLFSHVGHSPESDVTAIFAPFLWFSKMQRVAEREDKVIYPRTALWAEEHDMVEFESEYAALGLYYHGRDAFMVTREGVDAEAAEKARSLYWKLLRDRGVMTRNEAAIRKREERNQAWQPADRIEELRKLIEVEEIRLARVKLAGLEKAWAKSEDELRQACAKIDFDYRPEVFATTTALRAEVARLQAAVTELRRVEDYGSSLFYRKRIFYNEGYEWRLLGGLLASGDVSQEKEDTHVLHLLYRYRREGKRSEELIFPFIAIQNDGDDSRFSFLWRLFERREKGGKTGGYLFFIPYGDL